MTKYPACIILLKGVNCKDYKEVEDQFDQQLLESGLFTETTSTENNYETIPSIFTSIADWPTTSNLHCWTCECTFTSRPVFIPKHIKNISNGDWDIATHGMFCSFSCAARYINDFMNESFYTNLYKLYDIFNNKKVSYIYPSPSRYCMKKYGGHLSEGEFIEEIQKLENMIITESVNNDDISINNNEDDIRSIWAISAN